HCGKSYRLGRVGHLKTFRSNEFLGKPAITIDRITRSAGNCTGRRRHRVVPNRCSRRVLKVLNGNSLNGTKRTWNVVQSVTPDAEIIWVFVVIVTRNSHRRLAHSRRNRIKPYGHGCACARRHRRGRLSDDGKIGGSRKGCGTKSQLVIPTILDGVNPVLET